MVFRWYLSYIIFLNGCCPYKEKVNEGKEESIVKAKSGVAS